MADATEMEMLCRRWWSRRSPRRRMTGWARKDEGGRRAARRRRALSCFWQRHCEAAIYYFCACVTGGVRSDAKKEERRGRGAEWAEKATLVYGAGSEEEWQAGLSIVPTTAKLGGSQWGFDSSCWAAASAAAAAAADDDGDDDNNKETFKFYCTFPVGGRRPSSDGVGWGIGDRQLKNNNNKSIDSTGGAFFLRLPLFLALWFSAPSLSHLPAQHPPGLVWIICQCRSWLAAL